jgi:DNA-binding HxlR family transcriptional regulator
MSKNLSLSPEADALNAVLLAVRQAADVLCDRWTLSILLLQFAGLTRSSEFRSRTRIASRQLTQRLKVLEAQEIVVRMPYSRRPLRYGTHLTTMGQALHDVFACMVAWERKYGLPSKCNVEISHSGCTNHFADPQLTCNFCKAPVTARDVVVRRTGRSKANRLPDKKTTYRRTTHPSIESSFALPLESAIDILGDKWTIEILVVVLFKVESFVEIQNLTGISTNILSDRLTRLLAKGLLRRTSAEEQVRKGSYRITEKGIAFYPILVAIQEWADDWLPNRLRSPMILEHQPCTKRLSLKLRCNHCQNEITFGDSHFHVGEDIETAKP